MRLSESYDPKGTTRQRFPSTGIPGYVYMDIHNKGLIKQLQELERKADAYDKHQLQELEDALNPDKLRTGG